MTTSLNKGSPRFQIFKGAKGRQLRETLTAYLMIAPAMILIFTFGIFPVGFALFVSLHKWQLVQGPFLGLKNYTDAIGDLTYVALFALGLGGVIGAGLLLRRVVREARGAGDRPWGLILPSLAWAAVTWAGFRWMFLQLPEVLGIANKIKGLERTRELFIRLLNEAFHAETVYPAWEWFIRLLVVSVGMSVVAALVWRKPRGGWYTASFALVWLGLSLGVALLWVTYTQIIAVYAAAVETGEDPGLWPQLILIVSGILALIIGWRIWQSAEKQDSTAGFAVRLLGGLAFSVGAVLLIVEIPTIVAGGDPDMWEGLKVTIFFSLGTVPVQLTIALFL
ncbi:MAG TPA: hypothetical protein PK530_07735, partial [Anaerolineales bacterium]|nr:hypothetical protein [Anaerolineales bacterium]